ncbi:hypothetical protein V5O48_019382, partial [Marasmius crinis-equi]
PHREPYSTPSSTNTSRNLSDRSSSDSGLGVSLGSSWRDDNRAREVMANAWSPEKRKRLEGARRRLLAWADSKNHLYGLELWDPSESLLVSYVSQTMAGKVTEPTARRHCSLLKEVCEAQGRTWKGGKDLERCLRGVGRMVPPSSLRPDRVPVTAPMMTTLAYGLKLGDEHGEGADPYDSCVFAAAATGLFAQTRTGELLAQKDSVEDYNHKTHPVTLDLTLNDDQRSYSLFLPSTKTSLYKGAT